MHVSPICDTADLNLVNNIERDIDETALNEAAERLRATMRELGYGQFVPGDVDECE